MDAIPDDAVEGAVRVCVRIGILKKVCARIMKFMMVLWVDMLDGG